MSSADFEEYRQKLFRTNVTFFEIAVEIAKFGKKANKIDDTQLKFITDSFQDIKQ